MRDDWFRAVRFATPRFVLLKGDGGLDESVIVGRLQHLRSEHRDLDAAIDALAFGGAGDQLQIARFKKRKLRLKDEIASLEDQLIPDIIA